MLNALDVKDWLVYLFFHLLIHIYTWTPLAQTQHQHVSYVQVEYHVCTIICILDMLDFRKMTICKLLSMKRKLMGLTYPVIIIMQYQPPSSTIFPFKYVATTVTTVTTSPTSRKCVVARLLLLFMYGSFFVSPSPQNLSPPVRMYPSHSISPSLYF